MRTAAESYLSRDKREAVARCSRLVGAFKHLRGQDVTSSGVARWELHRLPLSSRGVELLLLSLLSWLLLEKRVFYINEHRVRGDKGFTPSHLVSDRLFISS